ncbi:MAG: acetylornithine/succinylornithine family transaminase [Burkholderiales bacterium]|nr:MAG: acetylornithine/succinylornithine family transaminase [Burkholderiales bacterium]
MSESPAPATRTPASRRPVDRATFDRVMVPTYAPAAWLPVRGKGCWLWDQDGRQYLDFTAGIAVSGLGHAHDAVVATLTEQAQRLWHVGNGYTNEPVLRLATALTEATFADRAFFANSGAEANEAAFKLARKWAHSRHGAGKSRLVACFNAFHGRTLFTVSVGGQAKYTEGYEPLPAGITHLAFNDVDALRAAMGPDVCALVIEPVQGEGGVTPATPEFLRAARELATAHQALLIFDEVQCGMGRTGALYAYMDAGVVPDILTTAKALGNGFPIGAMLTTEEIASAFSVGAHGSTYGGNPLAAAVALKVFETISEPRFLSRVREAGERLREGLEALVAAHPQVFARLRGRGLMLGMVLAEGFKGRAKELTRLTEAENLLLLIAGPDVVRVVPPLIVSDDEIDEALRRLARAVGAFVGKA